MKIAIEANIGCGKTTILNNIAREELDIPIYLEPVETKWKEGLKLFYENNERWGFAFNLTVLKTYHEYQNQNINNQGIQLYERSPLSCYHVFSKLQYENKKMTDYEHNLFEYIYNTMSWNPDVAIYVRTPPEVCFQRMLERGRECEIGVPFEYIKNVHEKYESMFEYLIEKSDIEVHIVDGVNKQEQVCKDVLEIIKSYM